MQRLKELDVLRGIAALNVVLFHYTSKFRTNFGHSFSRAYDWDYGQYGVELFFMISGFVIFMSLQGNTSLEAFAFKRFSRLYPTYWICVFLTFFVVSLAKDPGIEPQPFSVLLWNLPMVQGAFNIPNIDGVYWSLIPELFFYSMLGVLYLLKLLQQTRRLALIWLLLMILNAIYKLPLGAYVLNLQYGMFFMAGILFYKLKYEQGDWREHLLIGACFLTAIVVQPSLRFFYVCTVSFSLFYLFVYNRITFLSWKPFLFLGYISYPLYLLHQNIGFILIRKLGQYLSSEIAAILLTMISVILLAWLVTRFVEKPILHFLRNLRLNRTGLLNYFFK